MLSCYTRNTNKIRRRNPITSVRSFQLWGRTTQNTSKLTAELRSVFTQNQTISFLLFYCLAVVDIWFISLLSPSSSHLLITFTSCTRRLRTDHHTFSGQNTNTSTETRLLPSRRYAGSAAPPSQSCWPGPPSARGGSSCRPGGGCGRAACRSPATAASSAPGGCPPSSPRSLPHTERRQHAVTATNVCRALHLIYFFNLSVLSVSIRRVREVREVREGMSLSQFVLEKSGRV